MQNPFKKYPIWSAIGTILFFLFISVPLYLAAIWPILEWAHIVTPLPPDQTLPQWVLEKRWPGMTSAAFSWIILGSVVGMFVLLGKIIRVVHRNRKEVGWLEAIADEDDRDMENRIQVFHWNEIEHGPATNLHPSTYEPSIDLKATIQNNTVYALTITHIDGGLAFEKSYKSRPYHDLKLVNSDKKIRHVQPYKLKLRQHIHPDSAKQIMNDGGVTLRGGNAAVCCTYENRTGEQKSIRIPLNHLTFPVTAG